jgi:hypothetical protein
MAASGKFPFAKNGLTIGTGNDTIEKTTGAAKGVSLDVKEALEGANPNYNQNDPAGPYGINCQRSVIAYELHRRGYDVDALPLNDPDADEYSTLDGYAKAFVGIKMEAPATSAPENIAEFISGKMAAWGEGSRATIKIEWKNRRSSGHVFVAERIDRDTMFLDQQNGDTDVSGYFLFAKPTEVLFGRIDNLPLADDLGALVKKRG